MTRLHDLRGAEALLTRALGPGASFRPQQIEAIEAIVRDRARVLVVQATGWGKSVVYFIATSLLRQAGAGPTLLVSPLLSLMRDQVRTASRLGVCAMSMTSANRDEWPEVMEALARGEVDLLLISPERLANEEFATNVLPKMVGSIGMLVVDEAHCISDWGHDFRPDYRRIVNVVKGLPRNVAVLATTATANDRVVEDIEAQLGDSLVVYRGSLARPSLRLQSIELADQAERLAWLAEHLPTLPGAGIVYCLTVADCRRVAGWLRENGIDAAGYYADLDSSDRGELEVALLENRIKALIATVALGMGYDKPDLGFVVHFQRPGSIVAYYQQIGRAGRAVEDAYAILLNGREDAEIHDYFIETAFPSVDEMTDVVGALEAHDGLSVDGVCTLVDLKRGRVEHCLKTLEVDGAVYREGSLYHRSVRPWTPDLERIDAVTARRRHELARMDELVRTDRCLMQLIRAELDDPAAEPCGRCASCVGNVVPPNVSPALVNEARIYLRHAYVSIQPRRQWPAGIERPTRKNIPAPLRAEEGRALSRWGDAGWGQAVRDGKYRDRHFSDELVGAVAEMIARWSPMPEPTWVTNVPSFRHPELVESFARRLAERLNLPFEPALRKGHETSPQKVLQNATHQARNVRGAFVIAPGVPTGPVLLVDDVVDSGWTFAECACALREGGSGEVYPVALAEAAGSWRGGT